MFNKKEFEKQCAEQCEHCRKGVVVRYRPATNEYVHDVVRGSAFTHTICQANDLRKAKRNG